MTRVNQLHAGEPGARFLLSSAEKALFGLIVILTPFAWGVHILRNPIPPIYDAYTDLILYAGDFALVALLALWLLRKAVSDRKIVSGPWFLTWPIAGFSLAASLSAFDSVHPAISWMHSARLAFLFAFYLYIVNEVRSSAQLVIPVAFQVALQSVVAVAQFLNQGMLGLEALGEYALDPEWAGAAIVWAPGQIALRAYGLADHPNILGGCLAFGLVFLAYHRLETRETRRSLVELTIALGAIALLFSFSRSAWAGLAAGLGAGALILAAGRRRQNLVSQVLFGLGLAAVLAPFVFLVRPYLAERLSPRAAAPQDSGTLLSPEARSLSERAALIEAANHLFVANPVSGTGIGTFPVALLAAEPGFPFDYQPVHVVLLDAAVETGLPGALGYFLAIVLPLAALAVGRQHLELTPGLAAAAGLLAAVIVVGLFDYYPWSLTPGRLWHWLAWGLFAVEYRRAAAVAAS